MGDRRTNVGSRATVLQVTVPLGGHVPRDANGCTTVSDARAKVTNMTSLVTPSETEFVIFPINSDVFLMTL